MDGQTATFVLEAAPDELEMVIAGQLRGARARVVRLPRGRVVIEIGADHPVIASRIVSRPDGTSLVLELEERADAVRRRAMTAIPRSVPSEFVGPRVRHADAALTAGRLNDARQRFSEMTHEYSLRAWAKLRLSDIDLVSGGLRDACAGYRHVEAEFPQRTAGLVARMRLHGLECVQTEHVAIDWAHLVNRLRNLDGPVGRYLLREAAWVLHVTRDPEVINSALATTSPAERRTRLRVPPLLRHALLARAIRHTDTYSTAKVCFAHRPDLLRHPESRSLLLTCARATLDLDLPDTAVELIQEIDRRRNPAPAVWHQSRGDLQTLVVLARAYEAAGRTYLSQRAAIRYRELAGEPAPLPPERTITPADLEVGDAVARLQTRVDALRAHFDGEPTR
jgi:hypothetical protein